MRTTDRSHSPSPRLIAAVDLGSNSFRLLIGRVEASPLGPQIRMIDSLKESVRLAAGLTPDGLLDADSRRRALNALHRFGERLHSFNPDAVRAVATNTLRVARNARDLLSTAEAALGFPIDVISGREEARLIYVGAAHGLPADDTDRLVVDIGGGSTECVIGSSYTPKLLDSTPVGCVSMSHRFFADGAVDAKSFERAYYAARNALAPVASTYRAHGWKYVVGTSGTAKSLMQIARAHFGEESLTRDVLARLEYMLVKAGHPDRLETIGLRSDRRPVLPGSLALMAATFDELRIDEMRYCDSALREGLLYDLLGRHSETDMREITVVRMMQRYDIDEAQAIRVAQTALALFDQGARGVREQLEIHRELLCWGAKLAEVGMSISHEDHHRHSAYILRNADMPGFTQTEQALLSRLALGQVGGLRKMRDEVRSDLEWLMVLSLRLASILHRRRDGAEPPLPALFLKRRKVRIELPAQWAGMHPLSDQTLRAEAAAWSELRLFDEFVYATT